jgi:sec-independent protein translocase protein TatA
MFEGLFQPMHLILVLGIALIFFGPSKLPELGRGLGTSIKEFKNSMKAAEDDAAAPPRVDGGDDRKPNEPS